MPNIGYLFLHPLEGSLGTASVILGMARALAEKKVRVHIFTPFEKSRQLAPCIHIHRIPLSWYYTSTFYQMFRKFYYNPLVVKYLLNIKNIIKTSRKMAKKLLKYVQRQKIPLDALEGEQEPAALVAIEAAKHLKIPAIAHLHNLWPEELADMNIIARESPQYLQLRRLVQEIIQQADLTLTATPYMKQYLVEEYRVSQDKLIPSPKGTASRC